MLMLFNRQYLKTPYLCNKVAINSKINLIYLYELLYATLHFNTY